MRLCKSILDKLGSIADSANLDQSPLFGLSSSDAVSVLQPVILALKSGYAKVVEPAFDCVFKSFSLNLVKAEIDRPNPNSNSDSDSNSNTNIVYKIIDLVCKSRELGEEQIELDVLRVLLSAVRSPSVLICVVIV